MKSEKMHELAYFTQNLTKPALVSVAFGRKPQVLGDASGNFEFFNDNSIEN